MHTLLYKLFIHIETEHSSNKEKCCPDSLIVLYRFLKKRPKWNRLIRLLKTNLYESCIACLINKLSCIVTNTKYMQGIYEIQLPLRFKDFWCWLKYVHNYWEEGFEGIVWSVLWRVLLLIPHLESSIQLMCDTSYLVCLKANEAENQLIQTQKIT